MTIESAKDQLIQQLAGLYEPREAAGITHLVLEHLTGMNKTDRMIHKHQELSVEQEDRLLSMVTALLNNRPIQYVL